MKHKTWGELVQSRDATETDMRKKERGREEEEEEEEQREDADDTEQQRVVYTRFLVAASFVSGVVISQRGPSILDLGDVTHATLQSTASLFALGALGQMIGCVGAGLLLGRMNSSVFLFWVMLGMCASTSALPWCTRYGVMAAVYCLSLVCVGSVETGSYADIATRWGGQGGTKVQLLQLWFVVGGVLSPGMTQFFLAPRNHHHHHHHHLTSFDNVTANPNDTGRSASNWNTNTTLNNSVESTLGSDGWNASQASNEAERFESEMQTAYIISGVLALLVSVPFLVMFFLRKDHPEAPQWKRDAFLPGHLQVRDASIPVLLLVAVFIFFVCAVEESMHQFLFTFLIHEARWSTQAAGWVTSWFWGGMLLVRLVAYFLPDQIGDEVILALSCTALPCTLVGLHISVVFSNSDGVWACVFFTGMSVSLLFPVSFSWIHASLAQRTTAVSGVVMSASMVAGIVNPLVLGHLLHVGRHLGFTFLLTAEAVLALLLFLLLYVLSRRLTARWHAVATRKSIYVVPDGLEEKPDVDDVQDLDSS